jgi:hypothetical protein
VRPNYALVDGLVPLKSPVRSDPTTVGPRPIDGPVFRLVCATASRERGSELRGATGVLLDYVAAVTNQRRVFVSVVVSAVSPGLNAEMYEAVNARVMPADELPDGCRLHIGGPVEQGWRVITVWDSREHFDRFREDRLLPAIRELAGDEAPPTAEPEVNAVHKLIAR